MKYVASLLSLVASKYRGADVRVTDVKPITTAERYIVQVDGEAYGVIIRWQDIAQAATSADEAKLVADAWDARIEIDAPRGMQFSGPFFAKGELSSST